MHSPTDKPTTERSTDSQLHETEKNSLITLDPLQPLSPGQNTNPNFPDPNSSDGVEPIAYTTLGIYVVNHISPVKATIFRTATLNTQTYKPSTGILSHLPNSNLRILDASKLPFANLYLHGSIVR